MDEARALQHAGKAGKDARAATGNRGTVLAVPNVASAQFSGAAADGRQISAADQGREFSVEYLVPDAEFAALPGVIAKVETAACSLVAEDSDAGQAGKFVARQFGRE